MKDCPEPIPAEMTKAIRSLQTQLRSWKDGITLDPALVAEWDKFIDEWANDRELPLIVRKNTHPNLCGEVKHVRTGRTIAPSDNSPAHWVVIKVTDGITPEEAKRDPAWHRQIPMTMAMSRKDRDHDETVYKVALSSLDHANKHGWYLAHRERVGHGQRGRPEDIDIDVLKDHFRKFLKPSNMFLMPKKVAGLAEIDGFFDEV